MKNFNKKLRTNIKIIKYQEITQSINLKSQLRIK